MADLEKLVGLTITDIDVHKGAEDGTGFVYLNAVGADETPDIDDEIFDYKTSKPYVEAWSDTSAETTKSAGQAVSYGNVRAQHGAAGAQNAAGTICEPIEFNDSKKRVSLRIKVVDSDAITKVQEGVYRGVSIKGRLVGKKWRDGKYYRYTVDPVEFSLVDKPANPSATITIVKADGTTEIMKVAEGKTKRVAGKDLGPESFAYVGDRERTETWKLPIHDASHVRNALARFNQTEGIPEEAKGKVEAKIRRAAKRFGVDAASLKKSATAGELSPGAMQIGSLLDGWFYLRDTTILEAEDIGEILKTAVAVFDEHTEEVEDTILMAEVVDKTAIAEEVAKASAISRMKAARKAHDENSACLSGYCGHGDVEKCMEKVAENHKAIEAAFKDEKVKKSAAESEVEKAAKKAKDKEKPEDEDEEDGEEDGEEESGEDGKKKKSAKKEADESEKSAGVDEVKALREEIKSLREQVEKGARGKRPVPVHPGSTVVKKEGDGTGDNKDLVEKMSAIKADDPERAEKLYRLHYDAEKEVVKL